MNTTCNIQFYADKKDCYSNKFFSFPVVLPDDYFRVLLHFHCKKNRFRAIFLKTKITIGESSTSYSEELVSVYNFFYTYDSGHFPALAEALRDFEMWKLDPQK